MAKWVRRQPQGSQCETNEQALSCESSGEISQRTETTTQSSATGVFASPTVATENTETSVTMTRANHDGSVWASSYMDVSSHEATADLTTGVVTTSARTTPWSTFTEPPEAQSASRSGNDGGVSKGAVAGIAIGTCIVGAAIAFIAAWLLFKRRDKKFMQKTCPSGYPIYADSSPELVMAQKSAVNGIPYVQVSQAQMRTPVPVPARAPVASPHAVNDALTGILPPAATEHDVSTRISALFAEFKRHIDTFYRGVHASITPSMDSDLASFGKDVDMVELLQNCSHPTVALKHALTAFVLSITESKRDENKQTLWPSELTNFIKPRDSDSAQLAAAQALHRRLTVHIYAQHNALSPANRSQSRLSNLSALSLTRNTFSAIREAAEHFSLTFFPWANPVFGDQERESDLAGIVTEALETRIWLVGQTGEWDFEWEVPGRGAVVVSPSLVVREERRGPRRVVLDQSVVGV
ncbi:uncharacterized protein M421DRAFT_419983 [Didymella exigua CBS 183.55]|uniref:Uncharacterized protein n=1 Tax=Didymella exigua CBS 183.55 TaxID=1150837 RepID=A0A6A5RLZ4_9PLEO|nr:uncharacterized protein M421DRAFT_419983 [Didymella exigua CBS 183.55]KAF1929451.1 hypothetical protein M421DRAFT_419983 [Didymella exigua CBS 183.55]